jgi:hypothetical protein
MKRTAIYLALAALGAGLLAAGGSAWAQMSAPAQTGDHCATAVTTCRLIHPTYNCSCRRCPKNCASRKVQHRA